MLSHHIQFGDLRNSSLRELKLIECTGDDVSFHNFYVQKKPNKSNKINQSNAVAMGKSGCVKITHLLFVQLVY